MRPWSRVAALTAVLGSAALASPASAQNVEIAPVAGYRFGGSFDLVEDEDTLQVRDSGAWGVLLSFKVAEEGELEALYARQDTRLTTGGLFSSENLFDLALETWHFGGNYLFRDEDVVARPYIGVGLGVTRLIPEPSGLESETRFSASFAAGVKLYLSKHVGLRFEARGFFTVLESDNTLLCNTLGGCVVKASGSELSQGEVRGGLIFRF